MADKSNKTSGNVSGKYYVDESCISCGLCVTTAPDNFAMNSEDRAYVTKQPDGKEADSVAAALDACPTGSIGDDGN